MLWVETNFFLAFFTRKFLREIITACYSMSTVAMKLVLNSAPDIFKYLQHFIRGWAKLISGATLLKFWSMSQAKHISKCLSSGGNPGSSMGLLSLCKLNMCLFGWIGALTLCISMHSIYGPESQLKLIEAWSLRDFEPAREWPNVIHGV